jgi:protease-4
MKISKFYLAALISLSVCANAEAQTGARSFRTYRELGAFQMGSPGSYRFGLYGADNPALLSYNNSDMEWQISTSDSNNQHMKFNNWGIFSASENSGYSIMTTKIGSKSITDYKYALAKRDRNFGFGLAYSFVGGDKGYFNRSNSASWGFFYRPAEFLSISGFQTYALSARDAESVVDLAVRPIPKYPLTIYADYAMFHDQSLKDGTWSVGANWEFLDGLRLNGRYDDKKNITVSMDMSFRWVGISALFGMNEDGKQQLSTYSVRFGGPDRSIFDDMLGSANWKLLSLDRDIKYQKNLWFDNSITLKQILDGIDKAENDKYNSGIVIDARNINGGLEMLWEVRDRLIEYKKSGKQVVVFLERAGFGSYYFASVADKIVLDPMGSVQIKGLSITRSYYKKLLDKLGIGFDEIRLFKYKSAAESYARDKMSDGDREQRQKLIDDWYYTISSDVSKSRKFESGEFDRLVDDKISYTASEALKNRLVDTLARWRDMDAILAKMTSHKTKTQALISKIQVKEPFDDKWGAEENRIALVYVVGDCSMDGGIEARKLVNDVENAANDSKVKAIVLRVDSPGGDAMASDYIAEIVRKYKDKKPIIVSQGSVAASGGYWLSMDAHKIVSSPMTITGSIGVISSVVYDKGMKDSLGINTEIVKRGKYSDLGASFQLPLISLGLPLRNLNQDERAQYEKSISDMYKDFVTRVAQARNMSYEKVDSVAQGRVWSGSSAIDKGLVDELGGLSKAIKIAKKESGIPENEVAEIVEFPTAKLFNLNALFGGMFGISSNLDLKDSELSKILYRLEHNGEAMPILPMDYYQLND